MTEQVKAQDDVIECALFSDLHTFLTLFVLSLSFHSKPIRFAQGKLHEESQTTS